MKNIVLAAIAIPLLFICCNKENIDRNDETAPKKYAVRFDVSGFSQSMEDFDDNNRSAAAPGLFTKETQDSLRRHINYLYYMAEGKIISQTAADDSFGIIIDSLSAGSHRITLIGAKDSLELASTIMWGGEGPIEYCVFSLPGTDAFSRTFTVNVGGGAVNQTVLLNRIVARLKVTIKDRIPFDAAKITMFPALYFPDTEGAEAIPSEIYLPTGEPQPDGSIEGRFYGSYEQNIADSLKGTENYTTEFYLLTLTERRISLIISCLDEQSEILASKTVYNIPTERSKVSILSGNLFGGLSSDTGLNVIIRDTTWTTISNMEF